MCCVYVMSPQWALTHKKNVTRSSLHVAKKKKQKYNGDRSLGLFNASDICLLDQDLRLLNGYLCCYISLLDTASTGSWKWNVTRYKYVYISQIETKTRAIYRGFVIG